MKAKRIAGIGLGVAAVLLIPLVMTLLGSGVDGGGLHWTLSDFVIAGGLLFAVGLIFDYAMTTFPRHRVIVGTLIMFGFLWLWAELAVGVFTTWGS